MVLDEALNPESSENFREDSFPTSNPDPYERYDPSETSPSQTQQKITIPLQQLPGPMPIFGPLLGPTRQQQARIIGQRLQIAVETIKRPLTEEEANALAYHCAKLTSIASYGKPLGLAGGLYRAYESRETYRFPFYKPPEPGTAWFNPDSIGPFRGQSARIALHTLRATAYGAFGMFIGMNLIGVYAATVAAVGEQQDPRLKDLVSETMRAARHRAGGLPGSQGAEKSRPFGQPTDPTGQGPKTPGDLWREYREREERQQGDDVAPYGGSGLSDAVEESGERGGGTGMMSDSQMQGLERRQQARGGSAENNVSTFRMDKTASQPRPTGAFDDDVNSTDSQGSFEDNSPQQQDGQRGSAWERIRSQASPSGQRGSDVFRRADRRQQTGVQGEQRQGSTVGDGFSFSSSDEERQLAKGEAQKEFDERVERERRGEDFTGSTGGRGWRR